jgi:hypothetical protein
MAGIIASECCVIEGALGELRLGTLGDVLYLCLFREDLAERRRARVEWRSFPE